jgi:hypothetical protein
MKRLVRGLDEQAVRRRYPVADRVPGWFFRVWEQSYGCWRVDGTDLWGRTVSHAGADPDLLLENCIAAAAEINRQLAAHRA